MKHSRLPPPTLIERLLIVVVALVLAVGAIAALSGFFAGQDQAGVAAGGLGPGQSLPDQGDGVLTTGAARPVPNSSPPTSGAHLPVPVTSADGSLNVDQELEALAAGDVLVAYDAPRPPAGLLALAGSVAAPFSPTLALAGQAVILDRRHGTRGLVGVAWAHLIRVASPSDPALRVFLAYWLGRGAPRRH